MLPRSRLLALLLLACALVLSAAMAPSALAAVTVFDIDNQDLTTAGTSTQTGRLLMVNPHSACGSQKATPGTSGAAALKARNYGFSNQTTTSQCVTFTVNPKTCINGANDVFAAAYGGSWIASNPATNYTGDGGGDIFSGPTSFSIDVPAGVSTSLTVGAVNAGANCTNFRVTATSAKPIATVTPTLPGPAYVGGALAASNGSWPGSGSMTFGYAWQRCDAGGANCGTLAGAASTSYTPTADDVGHTLRVLISGTAGGQTSSSLSGPSNIVPATPPIADMELSKSGDATFTPAANRIGGSYDADDDTFTVSLPFQAELGGKPRDTVTVSANGVLEWDADKATDPSSYSAKPFPSRDLAGAIAPYWDDLDTSGDAGNGIYTETRGTAPNRTFVVEWRARSHVYTTKVLNFELLLHEDSPVVDAVYGRMDLTGDDATIGYQASPSAQQVAVYGSGTPGLVGQGTRLAFTPARGKVEGTAQKGATLTGTAGRLVGQLPIAASTQWLRCDAAGGGCSPVDGATALAYTAGDADVGHTLRLRTSGTNTFGSGQVDSPATGVVSVPAQPPAGPPPGGGPAPDKLAPALSRLSLKSTKLRRGAAAVLTLTLSEPARLTIAVQRLSSGHRKGRRCVAGAPKRVHGKRQKACTFARTVLTRRATGKRGKQTIKVVLGRLPVGRYRLRISAADAAGNRTAKPASLAFRVRR